MSSILVCNLPFSFLGLFSVIGLRPQVPQGILSSLAPFLPPQSLKACIPFCDPFPELPLYPPSPLAMLPWPRAGTPIRILHYTYFSYTPVSPTRLWAFRGLIHWFSHKQQIFNVYMCNVSPQGTYTVCHLSFIHWFNMITHSFIQCIWINRPLLRHVPCILIIKCLHHGVKWWPTLQWQRRGLMCSSVIVHKVRSFQITSDILMGTVNLKRLKRPPGTLRASVTTPHPRAWAEWESLTLPLEAQPELGYISYSERIHSFLWYRGWVGVYF